MPAHLASYDRNVQCLRNQQIHLHHLTSKDSNTIIRTTYQILSHRNKSLPNQSLLIIHLSIFLLLPVRSATKVKGQRPPISLLPCILPPAVFVITQKLYYKKEIKAFITFLTEALSPLKFCDTNR